jgi:hypothetical protein
MFVASSAIPDRRIEVLTVNWQRPLSENGTDTPDQFG